MVVCKSVGLNWILGNCYKLVVPEGGSLRHYILIINQINDADDSHSFIHHKYSESCIRGRQLLIFDLVYFIIQEPGLYAGAMSHAEEALFFKAQTFTDR